MSFLTIPQPIRELFDAFPRHQFPSTRQHTATEKQSLEDRRFSYGASTPQSPSTHFTLCVYNVFQSAENIYLATDPLCLSTELSLSLKNHSSLPKVNHDHTDRARNAVFVTSAHADHQGHLPLYIEEDPLRKSRRSTRDCVAIEETLSSRVESSSELMLITLVDSVVYDAWMTCVLLDVDDSVKSKIYQYRQGPEYTLVNKLGLHTVMSQLLTRNGFSLRNRQIAQSLDAEYTSLIHKVLPKTERGAQLEKKRNYREFEHALDSINSILERRKTQFFGINGGEPCLLDIKLASYTVLIGKFLSNTELSKVLDRFPQLKSHGQAVLKVCS